MKRWALQKQSHDTRVAIQNSNFKRGFTTVELLIVIAVIGILAAITIVSYRGVTDRADNATRTQQVKEWQKLLSLYKAEHGEYPAVPGGWGNFCLGTGFPVGAGGERRCREFTRSDDMSYREADNSVLVNELKKVGTLPTQAPTPVRGWIVGPWINYWVTGYTITQAFPGNASSCPSFMKYTWDDGKGTVLCYIDVTE